MQVLTPETAAGVRVGEWLIVGGFDDNVNETDQVNEVEGVRVVCDPKSFLYLNGTMVDFEESLMGRGFKFTNPNAAKSCGCGESFSV